MGNSVSGWWPDIEVQFDLDSITLPTMYEMVKWFTDQCGLELLRGLDTTMPKCWELS